MLFSILLWTLCASTLHAQSSTSSLVVSSMFSRDVTSLNISLVMPSLFRLPVNCSVCNLSGCLCSHSLKIGPLDLSSRQPKQAQFTWVHWWKLLLWIDLLSCYSLILVYTWIYKYMYENMGMETFTINSCPVSDKWNFEYCKVAFSLPR